MACSVCKGKTLLCFDYRGLVSNHEWKQGRIHGNPAADGLAGAVMRKPLAIQQARTGNDASGLCLCVY